MNEYIRARHKSNPGSTTKKSKYPEGMITELENQTMSNAHDLGYGLTKRKEVLKLMREKKIDYLTSTKIDKLMNEYIRARRKSNPGSTTKKVGAKKSNVEKGDTWKSFLSRNLKKYVKSEGGHKGAMKRMSSEWKAKKK